MVSITPETSEDELQLSLLETPLGEPGSGKVRYAAAMYFYRRGFIDEQILEAYRVVSKLDSETAFDPPS